MFLDIVVKRVEETIDFELSEDTSDILKLEFVGKCEVEVLTTRLSRIILFREHRDNALEQILPLDYRGLQETSQNTGGTATIPSLKQPIPTTQLYWSFGKPTSGGGTIKCPAQDKDILRICNVYNHIANCHSNLLDISRVCPVCEDRYRVQSAVVNYYYYALFF